MSDNVTPLRVVSVGESHEIAPDTVLEQALGKLTHAVLIGIDKDGELFCAGSHGQNYCLWLVEKAKKEILV